MQNSNFPPIPLSQGINPSGLLQHQQNQNYPPDNNQYQPNFSNSYPQPPENYPQDPNDPYFQNQNHQAYDPNNPYPYPNVQGSYQNSLQPPQSVFQQNQPLPNDEEQVEEYATLFDSLVALQRSDYLSPIDLIVQQAQFMVI